jgi:hypothetical protein
MHSTSAFKFNFRRYTMAHADACETLDARLRAIGCGESDLRWATGVLHSRCFTHGPAGTHLAVPGVDMCNHCFEAGAYTRSQFSSTLALLSTV